MPRERKDKKRKKNMSEIRGRNAPKSSNQSRSLSLATNSPMDDGLNHKGKDSVLERERIERGPKWNISGVRGGINKDEAGYDR